MFEDVQPGYAATTLSPLTPLSLVRERGEHDEIAVGKHRPFESKCSLFGKLNIPTLSGRGEFQG